MDLFHEIDTDGDGAAAEEMACWLLSLVVVRPLKRWH